ncbi:MAG: amylo-alpha-1,6-glucosidase [Bacteroidetes bacterium]|nr:MAG: amylo-alpha-1,6-glucosidase [Bacteroidota bacterium]
MGFIKFDKTQLINLEYSLGKEMLRSNRAGSFSCTTIIGCNTRKYHGLLICPQPLLGNTRHVLLSKIDETIIQRDAEFNIGLNRYPGVYNPKGHKYVRDFEAEIIPKITFRVGGVVLTKETLFVSKEQKVMIRYTLVEAQSPTTIRIKPFLAFRNIHELSKKNIYLDTKYEAVANGIKTRMYDGYSPLYMQVSKSKTEYVHSPDWYEDLEYFHEERRGYESREDLYVPGFFEFPIKKGESIIFYAGTEEVNPAMISRSFNKELKNRTPRNSYENSLINSAEQFFYKHKEGTDIIAGYPWYDRIGRFTFISLPGLSLARNIDKSCFEVINTMVSQMKDSLFPETGRGPETSYQSADTSLWFVWALQQCSDQKKENGNVWKNYGEVIKEIIESFAAGNPWVKMHDNNLLHIDSSYPGITWMNAVVNGKPVTPRFGYVVEVNALWYNALMFAIHSASEAKDKKFVKKWSPVAESVPEAFIDMFWKEEKGGLFDYVHGDYKDISIRPNQIIAASLPYSPLPEEKIKRIVDIVIKRLLTPRGLRTLSPENPVYKGKYNGNEAERDSALHQGTVHPWLLGHFAEAYFKIYGKKGVEFIEKIYNDFQSDITEDGVGTISELFEGDPPHSGRGAISFAGSVAELMRIKSMIENMKKKK